MGTRRIRLALLGGVVLTALSGGSAFARAPRPVPRETITWLPGKVDLTLRPGEQTGTTVVVRAAADIPEAALQIFAAGGTIQVEGFPGSLSAGQSYPLRVTAALDARRPFLGSRIVLKSEGRQVGPALGITAHPRVPQGQSRVARPSSSSGAQAEPVATRTPMPSPTAVPPTPTRVPPTPTRTPATQPSPTPTRAPITTGPAIIYDYDTSSLPRVTAGEPIYIQVPFHAVRPVDFPEVRSWWDEGLEARIVENPVPRRLVPFAPYYVTLRVSVPPRLAPGRYRVYVETTAARRVRERLSFHVEVARG